MWLFYSAITEHMPYDLGLISLLLSGLMYKLLSMWLDMEMTHNKVHTTCNFCNEHLQQLINLCVQKITVFSKLQEFQITGTHNFLLNINITIPAEAFCRPICSLFLGWAENPKPSWSLTYSYYHTVWWLVNSWILHQKKAIVPHTQLYQLLSEKWSLHCVSLSALFTTI